MNLFVKNKMKKLGLPKKLTPKFTVFKSEALIFSILIVLSIPGIINFIWFFNSFIEETKLEFIKRVTNTHQMIVNFYQLQTQTPEKSRIFFPPMNDLSNIYIFVNDSLVYTLNQNNKDININRIDSLWRLGFSLNEANYIKKTALHFNKNNIQIFSEFNLNPLKSEIKTLINKLLTKSLVIFLSFLIIFIFVVMTLIRPIKRFSDEIQNLASGMQISSLSTNYPFREFNQISQSINEILKKKDAKEHKIIEEVEGLIGYLTRKNEELEYAKTTAELANKYKTEFLANISHEIRTPLNAILGFTDQLLNSETDETRKYSLNVIKNSGRILIALVNDILDISKLESGKLELNLAPTNIKSILQETSDLYSNKALSKGISLIFDTDPKMPHNLIIDELRIRQILINLISNAIKFTEKGSITVTTKLLKYNPQQNKIDFLIKVTDTGIGIKKEFLTKIFEPFTQQEGQSIRKYGGTGLGLPIVKRLVELMDGRIEIKSTEGEGTEFTLYFPNVQLVDNEKLEISEEKFFFEFDLAKILIYQNNTEKTDLLVDILQDNKLLTYTVDTFENYLKYCDNEKIDIIIYCCPHIYDADEKNKDSMDKIIETAKTKHIPIIAILNEFENEDYEHLHKYNFDADLHKPLRRTQLFNTIAKLLNPSLKNVIDNKKIDQIEIMFSTFKEKSSSELLDKIRKEYSERAEELSRKFILSKTMDFINEFTEFANQYQDQNLYKICDLMKDNISKFQITSIKKILNYIGKL